MIPYKLLNFSAPELCQSDCYPSIRGPSGPPRGHVPVRLLDVTDISKRKLISERFRSPLEFGFGARIAFPPQIRTSVVRTRSGPHLKTGMFSFSPGITIKRMHYILRRRPFFSTFQKYTSQRHFLFDSSKILVLPDNRKTTVKDSETFAKKPFYQFLDQHTTV